jgi:putative ATPase
MEAPLAERIRPQQLEDYIRDPFNRSRRFFDNKSKGIIPSLIFGGHQVQENNPSTNYAQESQRPFFHIKCH